MDSETLYTVLAFVGLGIGFIFAWRALSPEARERRRRQRNYGKTVQKANRPMVKFTVKSPEDDKR